MDRETQGAFARPLPVDEVAAALGAGAPLEDALFDRFLPMRLRRASGQFWTPLSVVARVAGWLREAGVGSVVDLGSGAGKFCVAAALATTCQYIGLEHRARLVAAAGRLARQFGVDDRVTFAVHALAAGAVPAADAYYLYNPFAENRFGPDGQLDDDVALGEARYVADVAAVEDLLRSARPGTHVVTYNGFGGEVPAGYVAVRDDRTLPNLLQMWTRSAG